MLFLQKYKKILVVLVSIIAVFYALFLFVLPLVNLNFLKEDIQKIVKDSVKLNLDIENIKIVTTPNLKAGVRIDGIELAYLNGKNILQLDKAETKIALLPLLLKTVQVSDIVLEKPVLNVLLKKNGQLDVVEYVFENMPTQEQSSSNTVDSLPVRISDKLPKITVSDYALTLIDEKTNDTISIKGNDLILDKAVMNKHFRVLLNGSVLLNESENVFYDLNVDSFWPAIKPAQTSQEAVEMPQIDFVKEIFKYNPKAEIFADLKITENKGHINFNGNAKADKLSVVLDGQKLPDGYFYLTSKDNKINIDSELFVSNDENMRLLASVGLGKKTKIDLNFKTEKISFSSVQKFLLAFLDSLNVKNDFAKFTMNGFVTSDLTLKTDLKNMKSSGYLKVVDGSIKHQIMPINFSKIVADLDFSNDGLIIDNTSVVLNGTPLNIKGEITNKALADIELKSGDIDLSSLYNTFAPTGIKDLYILQNGKFNINAEFKGKLSAIEPNINLSLKGFALKDKLNSFVFANRSALVNIVSNTSGLNGVVDLNNTNFKTTNPVLNLSIPNVKINVTPTNIEIVPFVAMMNSSKVDISGSVKDYLKSMKMNISMDGKIFAKDLKDLLPIDLRTFVDAKGSIPIKGSILGNAKKIDAKVQLYSDINNHFAPIVIKKIQNQNGLVNVDISLIGDKLNFNDVSLNVSNKSEFSNDYAYNFKGAQKLVGLSGVVGDLYSPYPSLKLTFAVPEQLFVSVPVLANTSLKTKGEILVHNSLVNPLFRGFFSVKEVDLKDLLTKVQALDLEFNDSTMTAKVQNLDINGSSFNIDAEASTKLSSVLLVKNMRVTSSVLDVDNLFVAMDKMMKIMPATSSTTQINTQNTPLVPVKILNGSLDIQKLKMKQIGGDFMINNISSPFNLVNDLFTLNGLKAAVYNGNVVGDITYNLASTAITADVKGKNVDANNIVTVFVALKDQVTGNVDFNAKVKLKGATYEEQMKTLNGFADFELKGGQLGSLGRFETFLKADNLLAQGFISTAIGGLIDKVAPYNTGKYEYLNGHVDLVNGVAKLDSVKMSGPHMSLLILGDVDIFSMDSNMKIMGSLSPEIVDVLGPVSNLSVEKFAAYIPKFGTNIANAMNNYNEALNKKELEKIPQLTPKKEGTQSFKVLLDGNLNNPPAAIKRFQWLNTPEKIAQEQKALNESVKVNLPKTKEELKQQVQADIKNQLENNEKIQEIKQNKTVKTLTGIYNFYKTNKTK